jgi:intracellular sulfur oxidation DsrE/DsrF family protein
MAHQLELPTPRRGFLGTLAAALAAGVSGGLPARLAAAPLAAPGGDIDTGDRWLLGLKGRHRQLFDMPDHEAGVGLLHVMNYLDTYNRAYATKDTDVNAVVTLYGRTIPLGMNDAMWAKYPFGRMLNLTDAATGRPLARNMFAHPQPGDSFANGMFGASVDTLRTRGVTFILCNNALGVWAGRLSKSGLGAADAIRADLTANTLPGVVIVPGMTVAINKAQEKGLTYMRLG